MVGIYVRNTRNLVYSSNSIGQIEEWLKARHHLHRFVLGFVGLH
jgi:hypothetical protein